MKVNASIAAILLAGAMCVPAVQAQTATATAAPSSVQRLPDTVYAYFSIPNVSEMKGRMKSSLMGQMVEDPEMKAFKGEMAKLYDKVAEKLMDEAGLSLDEILEIPKGEVAFAVVSQRNKIGVAVFADFKGSEDQMEKLLDRADEVMREQGIESETEEFADTDIRVYAKPDSNSKRKISYFIKDSQMVASTEVSILEGILSRWEGGETKSFANNDQYSYILDRCGANSQTPAMTYFANPMGLFDKAINTGAIGQGNMQVTMAAGMIPVIGLDKFKATGGTIDMGVDGKDSVVRNVMFVDQPPVGVLKVFQLEETDQTPPAWVAADAGSFTSMKWSVSEAYDGISGLVDMVAGGPGTFERMVDQAAADENGLMIHAKKDLVDQMTGQIQIYSAAGDEDAEMGSVAPTLIALGCKDTDAMRSVVARIAESDGFPGESRDFRGVPLLEIPNPSAPGGEKMVLTVANQTLMFSTDVTMVEGVLRGDSDIAPLSKSDMFKQVAKHFPAKSLSVSYGNNQSTVKSVYEMLRTGQAPAMGGDIADIMEEIDFTTLPNFDAIKKYFPASGSFMVSDKNGAFTEMFSLTP